VITVSDSVASGGRLDRSGPAVSGCLVEAGFRVVEHRVVPDGSDAVRDAVRAAAVGFAGLILTTGGTGFAPRDLTPEGTAAAVERDAPGLAEAMRDADPRGPMTRGVAGIIGRAIVCNLPGSPDGATRSLTAIIGVLPHVLALAAGEDAGHH